MRRNLTKTQMYQQKLLKRMPTFLQTLFTRKLIRLSIKTNFHLFKARGCDTCFKEMLKKLETQFPANKYLKNISKVYESVMFKQIGDFKFQCDFRKGYSTQ